jgi:hypothetical protein
LISFLDTYWILHGSASKRFTTCICTISVPDRYGIDFHIVSKRVPLHGSAPKLHGYRYGIWIEYGKFLENQDTIWLGYDKYRHAYYLHTYAIKP